MNAAPPVTPIVLDHGSLTRITTSEKDGEILYPMILTLSYSTFNTAHVKIKLENITD